MTDDELMAAAAAGDEGAFRRLVERWEAPVFAFLTSMVGSDEDARDLSQETFVRVYASAGRYRGAGRFRGWLFRIAGNLARSRLRRARILRWVRFDPRRHDVPAAGADPGRDAEQQETTRHVRAALARLPARQRQALLLRRFEDLGAAEIAATLGTTVPGVESLLQRAMARLRDELVARGVKP